MELIIYFDLRFGLRFFVFFGLFFLPLIFAWRFVGRSNIAAGQGASSHGFPFLHGRLLSASQDPTVHMAQGA